MLKIVAVECAALMGHLQDLLQGLRDITGEKWKEWKAGGRGGVVCSADFQTGPGRCTFESLNFQLSVHDQYTARPIKICHGRGKSS